MLTARMAFNSVTDFCKVNLRAKLTFPDTVFFIGHILLSTGRSIDTVSPHYIGYLNLYPVLRNFPYNAGRVSLNVFRYFTERMTCIDSSFNLHPFFKRDSIIITHVAPNRK